MITAANAALALAEALIPKIRELARRGEITTEQQTELLRRVESLKAKAAGEFSGPEWQVSR